MTTKKIIGLVVSLVLLAAVAGVIAWAVINFDKVKSGMDGSGLYTKTDLDASYADGYQQALTDKAEYEVLIQEYRDNITELNDTVSQLNSEVTTLTNTNKDLGLTITTLTNQKSGLENTVTQLTTIKEQNEAAITKLNTDINNLTAQINSLTLSGGHKDEEIANLNAQLEGVKSTVTQLQNTNALNLDTIATLNEQVAALNRSINTMLAQSSQNQNTITALNGRIAALEKSVTYYQQLITAYQSEDKAVVTFMYNDAVYNVQVVDKQTPVTVSNPESTPYLLFNGWSIDGVTAVNLATYTVTENVMFTALITYRYDVKFIYETDEYASQIVVKNEFANITAPVSTAYKEFKGWSVDGNTVINLADYPITANTTFYAVIAYKADVTFKVDNINHNTQIVVIGGNASVPGEPEKAGFVFKGWAVNGSVVDVAVYTVQGDTTFTAVFNRLYAVSFKVDGSTVETQSVENGTTAAYVSVADTAYIVFKGWSIDGVSIVDIYNYTITADTVFIAVITKSYDVAFLNGTVTVDTQIVQDGKFAAAPANPTRDGFAFTGWAVDGAIVNVAVYPITAHTEFTAMFNTLYTVEFKVDNAVHDTQKVESGKYAVTPGYPIKNYYTFLGWSLDGTNLIDLSTHAITGNTTFIGVFKLAAVSFASDSWDLINFVSQAGLAQDLYKVGDEKTITLSTGEPVTFLILGFNHDDLTSGGKAGISIGMKHLLTATAVMSTVNTAFTDNGGWSGSNIRNNVLPNVFNTLPTALQAVIKDTSKKSTQGNVMTNIITTSDKLFLFSERELTGATATGYASEGNQYEYWKGKTAVERKKSLSNGAGSSINYWLRSGSSNRAHARHVVGSDTAGVGGGIAGGSSSTSWGICFGFCI